MRSDRIKYLYIHNIRYMTSVRVAIIPVSALFVINCIRHSARKQTASESIIYIYIYTFILDRPSAHAAESQKQLSDT